jgi:putative glutamine amidotransferase
MQPVIAITVGEVINYDTGLAWAPTVYGQSHTYVDAIVSAGGAPFILPLVDDRKVLRKLYEQTDGILLSGGHDIDLTTDGPPSKNRAIIVTSPRRDHQEIQLLKWAIEDNKPVLGICRGMQLINVALGGTLYKDISSDLPKSRNHELSFHKKDFRHIAHNLDLTPDSQLATILGTEHIDTNALHHQAIKELGKGLVVTAHAEDGVIEAIELPGNRFVIGVQSHPEALEDSVEPLWHSLFEAFVKSCPA